MASKETWEAAKQWVRENAKSLDLIPATYPDYLWLVTGATNLVFFAPFSRSVTKVDREAEVIAFGQDPFEVKWRRTENPEPPASLEQLLQTGSLAPYAKEKLKRQAEAAPGFAQAYDEIYVRLFPPLEHHELYTDTGDYIEAFQADKTLIARLKRK